jgi:hypothetical protein
MTYEVDPNETFAEPEPILSIGDQQWYPEGISECHMVIRGLARDLAGQVQETERLRRQVAMLSENVEHLKKMYENF